MHWTYCKHGRFNEHLVPPSPKTSQTCQQFVLSKNKSYITKINRMERDKTARKRGKFENVWTNANWISRAQKVDT